MVRPVASVIETFTSQILRDCPPRSAFLPALLKPGDCTLIQMSLKRLSWSTSAKSGLELKQGVHAIGILAVAEQYLSTAVYSSSPDTYYKGDTFWFSDSIRTGTNVTRVLWMELGGEIC